MRSDPLQFPKRLWRGSLEDREVGKDLRGVSGRIWSKYTVGNFQRQNILYRMANWGCLFKSQIHYLSFSFYPAIFQLKKNKQTNTSVVIYCPEFLRSIWNTVICFFIIWMSLSCLRESCWRDNDLAIFFLYSLSLHISMAPWVSVEWLGEATLKTHKVFCPYQLVFRCLQKCCIKW